MLAYMDGGVNLRLTLSPHSVRRSFLASLERRHTMLIACYVIALALPALLLLDWTISKLMDQFS